MDAPADRRPVIEFVRKGNPDGAAEFFACGHCGHVTSPRMYVCKEDEAIAHARAAATNCALCAPDRRSDEDLQERRQESRSARIAKAVEVTDLGFCFSDRNGNPYPTTEDAADCGETGVFGSNHTPFRIDIGSLVDQILDGHHEDCSVDDLVGVDALATAIDAFNAQQTGGSYDMDEKIWQKLPQRRTFAIIKPDAVARGIEQDMVTDIENAGFRVIESRRVRMTVKEAEWLYREHSAKGHFRDLVDYTVSDDVVMLHLEGDHDDAALAFRMLMGPTNKDEAQPHTLRARYAIDLRRNSVHGSDSANAAIDELCYFMS